MVLATACGLSQVTAACGAGPAIGGDPISTPNNPPLAPGTYEAVFTAEDNILVGAYPLTGDTTFEFTMSGKC